MARKEIDIATRTQALSLLQVGCPIHIIIEYTQISKSSVYRIQQTASVRGYNPSISKTILSSYIKDAPQSGRPVKATPEVEELIIRLISKNSSTREYSYKRITDSLAPSTIISASTVYRTLKRRSYRACKPTTKPSLTAENKLARLQFCLDHKDWTLEDWKNVI